MIAYFTWAENTVVEDESRIDLDATTSASVLAPGNAARIAGWIQERRKTVIPFVTHGTGGMAGTIEDMTASLPDSTDILESIGISRSEVEGAQETVNGWLDELGFTETAAGAAQR